ncbi:hypothetical protein BJ742DRAFT_779993 [Cladochytrium replicatum]|nr:hypothetical protein BJ742DRAFT_779993 [Cladochytrium replicatum]
MSVKFPELKPQILSLHKSWFDAASIPISHLTPELQVDAISVVRRNVDAPEGTRNVDILINLAVATSETAKAKLFVALDGIHRRVNPVSGEHAAMALVRMANERPGEYALLTLGPVDEHRFSDFIGLFLAKGQAVGHDGNDGGRRTPVGLLRPPHNLNERRSPPVPPQVPAQSAARINSVGIHAPYRTRLSRWALRDVDAVAALVAVDAAVTGKNIWKEVHVELAGTHKQQLMMASDWFAESEAVDV